MTANADDYAALMAAMALVDKQLAALMAKPPAGTDGLPAGIAARRYKTSPRPGPSLRPLGRRQRAVLDLCCAQGGTALLADVYEHLYGTNEPTESQKRTVRNVLLTLDRRGFITRHRVFGTRAQQYRPPRWAPQIWLTWLGEARCQ